MKQTTDFDPLLIQLFSDPEQENNMIIHLLNMELEDWAIDKINLDDINDFILFLRNHYSESEIYKLFTYTIE